MNELVDTTYCSIKDINTIQVRIKTEYLASADDPVFVRSTEDAYQVFKAIFATLDQSREHFIILALSRANEVRCYKVVTSGGKYFKLTDPRIVLRTALLLGAVGLVVCHNHPLGKLDFAAMDLEVTESLILGSTLLGVNFCDHIIYGEKEYNSLHTYIPELFGDKHSWDFDKKGTDLEMLGARRWRRRLNE